MRVTVGAYCGVLEKNELKMDYYSLSVWHFDPTSQLRREPHESCVFENSSIEIVEISSELPVQVLSDVSVFFLLPVSITECYLINNEHPQSSGRVEYFIFIGHNAN